uniref:eIF3h C-terminal domain-containing protein n=1 Tax=Monodelphis domestica TaxID=13616 RepID=A0A5F8HI16_MONDO
MRYLDWLHSKYVAPSKMVDRGQLGGPRFKSGLRHFPDSLLIAGQMNTYCQNIQEFTAQNLGKVFMLQVLQEYNN